MNAICAEYKADAERKNAELEKRRINMEKKERATNPKINTAQLNADAQRRANLKMLASQGISPFKQPNVAIKRMVAQKRRETSNIRLATQRQSAAKALARMTPEQLVARKAAKEAAAAAVKKASEQKRSIPFANPANVVVTKDKTQTRRKRKGGKKSHRQRRH